MERINKSYAEQSRFKGTTMLLSSIGQKELSTVICKRINAQNVVNVSKVMSSNLCENYYSCLTKYTEGKRLNVDFSDTWRVQQAFVAGLMGNNNLMNEIKNKIGVESNKISIVHTLRINKEKAYQRIYHWSEKQIKRRQATKQVRAHQLMKNEGKSGKHRSEKLKSTDTFAKLVSDSVKIKPVKESKCSNCGEIGHTTGNCIDLKGKKKKSKSKAKSSIDIANMF